MENPDNSEVLRKVLAKLEDLDPKVTVLTAEVNYEDAIATAGRRGDLPSRAELAP